MVQEFEGKENVPTLSTLQLKQRLAKNPEQYVLVDVREQSERDVSVIPNAISKEELLTDLGSKNSKYRNKKIVSYCTIGYRSMNYTKELKEEKGLDAYNLRGSILSWLHEGGAVVSPKTQKEVYDVHVYGKDWKLAPTQYNMHIKPWYSSFFGN